MNMPTKTYPDETMSLTGPDAHADNINAGIAYQEDGISPRLVDVIDAWEGVIHRWVMRYSMTALRISMGLVALGFGVLKYFPGVSPAQDLVLTLVRTVTFGLVPAVVPDSVVMIAVATLECVIGVGLILGRRLRTVVHLTALWVMGILSPLVVLPGRLFGGPDHAPTLEGQYVLKDVILLAAVMAIATTVRQRPDH
jgi:putative oxidoreductase